jgi:hypothetical protein
MESNTYNAIYDLLLGREVDVFDKWVRRRKLDDRSIENRSLHGATHHCVRKQGRDTTVRILGTRIAKVSLEGLPVHAIVCFEES